jgi:hypothetical protein
LPSGGKETALALSDDLRYWINLSHALAWRGTAQTQANPNVKTYWTPDEPGLVAALLDNRIQSGLEGALRKNSTGSANVRIDSIFTHKTPTVRFGGRTPVEIGDLLLIRQHFDTQTLTSQGKALLLQAKKNTASDSGSVLSGNPNTQFELYKGWAPFEGVTRLAVGPWDFLQTNRQGRFGEYLAVFAGQAHAFTPPGTLGTATAAFTRSNYPSPPQPSAWANGAVAPTASSANFVQCPDDFAITLSKFFAGCAGESFIPGPIGAGNDWSDFVNTMLGEAAKIDYTFISRRTNIQRPTRRIGTINAFVAIQPLLKLALMQQVQQYVPGADHRGIPDFQNEPHFFGMARDGSDFVKDLYGMDQRLRKHLFEQHDKGEGGDNRPPVRRRESELPGSDGGHVPILSISSSGPEPLWKTDTPN